MKNVAVYSAILEVEGHANGGKHDFRRYSQAITNLRKSSIKGHDIISVVGAYRGREEPARVKHFGYNYLCSEHCPHEPIAYGILRYFGFDLVIEQPYESGIELFGTYQVDAYSQICICGVEKPDDGKRKELEEAKELRKSAALA